MNFEIVFAALGGALAAVALGLVVARFSGRRGHRAAFGLLRKWLRTSPTKAVAPLAAIAAIIGYAFVRVPEHPAQPFVASAKLEASALTAFTEAPGSNADRTPADGVGPKR